MRIVVGDRLGLFEGVIFAAVVDQDDLVILVPRFGTRRKPIVEDAPSLRFRYTPG